MSEESKHVRAIDRWLKWVAVLGPMVSGIVFGGAGYVAGFQNAKEKLTLLGGRVDLIQGRIDKQDDFNKTVIEAIATLKEVVKRIK